MGSYCTLPFTIPHAAGIVMGSLEQTTAECQNTLTRKLLTRLQPALSCHNVVSVDHDHLGKPVLDRKDIAISFSYCQGIIYGAVAQSNTLGLDAATADDFKGNYPYHRIFHNEDLHMCKSLQKDTAEAAAMLWSCKEAMVKALGTGFRTLDPLDLRITKLIEGPGYQLVVMDGKATSTVFAQKSGDHHIAITKQITISGCHAN